MSPPPKKESPDGWAPRRGGGGKTSARNIREQKYCGNNVISLTEPAIRLLKAEALLRDIYGLTDHSFLKAKPDLSRFTAIIDHCSTIAILSAELGVTRKAGLGRRIRSLIREMTRNFNRVCFDLHRAVDPRISPEGPGK
jgi:hypothetical protein